MTGFRKETLANFCILKRLLKEGMGKRECLSYFNKKYGWNYEKFGRLWYGYIAGVPVKYKNPLPKVRKEKIIIDNGGCYFCRNEKVINHHINYSPEEKIKICYKCHGKLHFLIKAYHENIRENGIRLKNYELLFAQIKNSIKMFQEKSK